MYDLIVIGAGPGGYEAAAHAGQLGKKVALIEKEALGGVCLNRGCIPTKTLLHSAHVLEVCRGASAYGIQTGELEIDFARIKQRQQQVVEKLTRGVRSLLKRSQVETLSGQARLTARNTVAVGETTLEAKQILIATGSRPLVPPIAGIDSPAVKDSSGLLQLAEIPPILAVIGASAVGLEFAAFYNALGCQVTVFEMLDSLAPLMDRELTSYLQQELARQGLTFKLSARVTQISGNSLTYTSADGKTSQHTAQVILNATGRRPNTAGLGLEEVGVAYDASGIHTDERGRTNVPGIWACGDVTGRLLLAHAATREGIVAVNNMFGTQERMRYRAIPSVIYTHPELASVGYSEQQLQAEERAYKKALVPLNIAGRFLAENEAGVGYVKVLAGAEYGELLGVQILGGAASEMIYGIAAFLELELCTEALRDIVFPHPTVSEALKEAINRIK